MLRDHLCGTAYESLVAAAERAEQNEAGATPVEASATAHRRPHLRSLRLGALAGLGRGRRGHGGWHVGGTRRQPLHGRSGSLTEVLIAE